MRTRTWLTLVLLVACFAGCGGDDSNESAADASGSPDPALQMAREGCTFTPGATVSETLGLTDAARAAIPIKHVVILMKENRSFDHLLGKLHDQGQPAS